MVKEEYPIALILPSRNFSSNIIHVVKMHFKEVQRGLVQGQLSKTKMSFDVLNV